MVIKTRGRGLFKKLLYELCSAANLSLQFKISVTEAHVHSESSLGNRHVAAGGHAVRSCCNPYASPGRLRPYYAT